MSKRDIRRHLQRQYIRNELELGWTLIRLAEIELGRGNQTQAAEAAAKARKAYEVLEENLSLVRELGLERDLRDLERHGSFPK